MSMEGQPPDDLQEAVAATLRRLRGESRDQQAGATRRLEPQFSSTPAASPTPIAAPNPAGAPTLAQKLAADLADQASAERDLLSAVTENSDIPPSPRNREALRQTLAAQIAADDAQQSRRHRFRYVGILCLIVVLVGVGWGAYRNYAGHLRGGEVPVISADQTPEKIPPASQAAAETPSDDKTVYDEIAPGAPNQQKSEVLLPQPEAPALPPAPASAAPSGQDTRQAATGAATESPPPPAPAARDASASPPGPTVVATTTGESPTAGASSPASAATSPASSAAPQPPAAGATSTASTEEPQVPAAADTPTAPGNYRIQLAATKSEPAAEATWKRLATKYQDVLASLTLHVEKTDLGSKGIYYRVQAGPFTDKAAARDVCIKLKAQGQQCLVKP
jgi:SPOR domain